MILFLFVTSLWAQEVVIQGEETSNLNYQKHLMENPQRQSFIQYQISKKPTLTYELLGKLKSAQFEFLNGDLKKSQRTFSTNSESPASSQLGVKRAGKHTLLPDETCTTGKKRNTKTSLVKTGSGSGLLQKTQPKTFSTTPYQQLSKTTQENGPKYLAASPAG